MRWAFAGSLVLVALAGCGRFFQFAEREPWRREAEIACLNSGAVKEKLGIMRAQPIGGPGICGADFPLKVAMLGDSPALAFAEAVIRPPASIPQPRAAQQPRWPLTQSPYAAPPPRYAPPADTGAPLSLHPSAVEPHPNAPRTIAPTLPPLGPPRTTPIAATPVEVTPAATLACPIVSALDQWVANSVQPSAHKWFGQPVAEIKQISAYSCRGMNGQPGARISEHAFGNALDIAAFVLADGRRITVREGWRGPPEEQGFLRDIQGAACDQFTTVLAPGSNAFHYDHIHVDLMRRDSGRRICEPGAVDGEAIAARVRRDPALAARGAAPPMRRYDPPFNARNDPFAWRGDIRRGDPAITGSVPLGRAAANPVADDNDWVEDPGPRPPIEWSTDRHRPR
jgi:hypothetical protein